LSLLLLARDEQAKLASPYCRTDLSICPSICVSVRDSLSMNAALRVASHVDYRLVTTDVHNASPQYICKYKWTGYSYGNLYNRIQ